VRVSKDTHTLLFSAMNKLSQECGMRVTMGKVVDLLVKCLVTTDIHNDVDVSGLKQMLKESFKQ
jgi:hypothetical protein